MNGPAGLMKTLAADSRAEGPWLGELLAPRAEKDRFRETASYESPKENALCDLPAFRPFVCTARCGETTVDLP